ncbi:hypothetical protein L0668_14205 [Paraglaciecola aquimarina]|uniref:Uncharacterized protein n=1 Tax=Paraglaciecola algarum TaxID=3050085 RepID=A0ABS9DB67_9ALTE|nr:hypothetical protein [Paraglaciecola sp. G1-23]MCF2949267.1 hypothetical protein [Paraglaciecola sp. G1-23]
MTLKFNNETIEASSFIFSKIFNQPDIHATLSIDMISVTVPLVQEHAKKLLSLQRYRTADYQFKLIVLDGKEAGQQKYKRRLDANFSDGSTLSIFLFGLNEFQNPVKIFFNPNRVSRQNAATILRHIQDILGHRNYRLLMLRSNVTRVDYSFDLPNVPFEHVIIDYAYSPPYESFFEHGSRTGFRFGNKTGCPVITYDKAKEQSGIYLGYSKYTRIEKQQKPRARGAKSMFKVGDMDEQKYSFQGLIFYDPKLLINMPSRVLTLIEQYGISKARSLLDEPDRTKLYKRMEKYRLVRGTEFKKALEQAYQNKMEELKLLLVEPQRFVD